LKELGHASMFYVDRSPVESVACNYFILRMLTRNIIPVIADLRKQELQAWKFPAMLEKVIQEYDVNCTHNEF
jgi:hypothetical protein